ncbi:MAG: alpha/beta family hydrolase [Alphaproteobacteria bacterium]
MANSSRRSDLLLDRPADAPLTVAFAHGAGAPMDHPFMARVAEGIAAGGFRVARFEFPYMQARRRDGRKRPPDRAPLLRERLEEVALGLGTATLVLAGKSMGARIAADVADTLGVRGLIGFGFPFHAPGKPVGARADALKAMHVPTLILQGERDPFGNRADIAHYRLSGSVRIHYLTDGDHSLKPRKASGRTEEQNLAEAVAVAVDFLNRLVP